MLTLHLAVFSFRHYIYQLFAVGLWGCWLLGLGEKNPSPMLNLLNRWNNNPVKFEDFITTRLILQFGTTVLYIEAPRRDKAFLIC